jgi:outer membrane lipoprotein SlyB
VTLTVTKLNRSENVNDPIEMEFSVDQVSFGGKSYSLSGSSIASGSLPVERVRNQPKSKDVQKVVGGAAIGAIAGQILGKNTKSTVVGAAAGAAAGAATAAATANYEGCVRAGGNFVVRLSDALTVTT